MLWNSTDIEQFNDFKLQVLQINKNIKAARSVRIVET